MELSNKKEAKTEVVDFTMRDFIQACLPAWHWFVASMAVCVSLALLYIFTQEPEYERSEQILIKDQDSGGGIGEIADAFSSFGLVSSNTNVNNELISLTSPAIMHEVAKRLGLDVNYSRKGVLHPVTLYGKTLPVIVEFPDVGEQEAAGMRMTLQSDGGAVLDKFEKVTPDGKVKFDDEIVVRHMSDTVKTPLGRVILSRNTDYIEGKTDENQEIKIGKMPMQTTVEHYGKKLNGDLVDQDAEVIELIVKDVCVQRAVDILNEILVVYNENWIEDKNKLAVATSAFIDERLRVIQNELGDVDTSIARLMESTETPSLELTAQLSLEQSGELNAQILELSNQLAVARYMKEYIGDKRNAFSVIPVNTGISNTGVEADISSYNTLLLTRNNLVDNSSLSNPLVQDYDSQLAGMRQAIIKGIDNQISRLSTTIKGVQTELGKTKGRMMNTPSQALPLLSEERQQKVKESLYLFLLQKREENQLSQKFTADNTRIITPPMGSLKPVSPRKKLILIIAFLMGIAIPLTGVYMVKTGDTKVRSRKDMENLGIPFAGEIPYVGKKRKFGFKFALHRHDSRQDTTPLAVVEEGKRDVVNEAFRVVRGNIEYMGGRSSGCKLIMFTSFNPGSGKSFISYNLALSFALKRKRVLLIDCDLRHGSASMFAGSPSRGLSDFLRESTDDWKGLVVELPEHYGLSVLPTGKMPPNPAELLENGRLGDIIEATKTEYDYIFLDCPPVNIVVDTQIVGRHADSTIFIVRAGLLERQALKELEEFYQEKKFPHMSLILNGTDAVHSRYYTYGNYQDLKK